MVLYKEKIKISEYVIVPFLCSGLIKSLLSTIGLNPILDITYVTGLLIFFIVLINYKSIKQKHQIPLFLFLIFTSWAIFTATYTSSDHFFQVKLLKIGQILASFLAGYYIISNDTKISFFRKMIFTSIILGVVYTFGFIYFALASRSFEEITSAYLQVSLLCSFSLTALIVFNKNLFRPSILIILIVICLITMLGSGGRGGIIFSLISLIFYTILERKNTKYIFLGGSLIVALTILAYSLSDEVKLLFERSIYRLSLLTNQDKGASVDIRFELINFTINRIEESPIFGYGIGSFSKEYFNIDGRYYPHNILLEIWFELGLIGLILFFLFLISIISIFKIKANKSLFILLIPPFLNSLKSLDFTEHRLMFFCLGMMLGVSKTTLLKQEKRIEL